MHLEQTGPYPETVLGLLRRRYAGVHGYNTNLLPALERRQDFAMPHLERDVMRAIPLYPWTVVRWQSDPKVVKSTPRVVPTSNVKAEANTGEPD